jgi:1-acyl-sn-glycerol-3-phosphate acyltransferase
VPIPRSAARKALPLLIRLLKSLLRAIYGAYCWLAFLAVGLGALLVTIFVPGVERRRAIAGAFARVILRAWGVRLQVTGADMPPDSCIVVANHASYLDGVVLVGALPTRFGFVIKKEMDRIPLANLLLRRIGSEFVDRFNRHKGAMDARRVLRRATSGQSLVFFPEGTFSKQRGLLRFHTGAFATAVRASCAVVPVVIRGAREVLPWHRVIPTPGPIQVEILPALKPSATARDAAIALREEARRRILDALGEPDLSSLPPVEPTVDLV